MKIHKLLMGILVFSLIAFISIGVYAAWVYIDTDLGNVETVSIEMLKDKGDETYVSGNGLGADAALNVSAGDVTDLTDADAEDRWEDYTISLMAVGDNLMHMGVINTGKKEDGTYDYTELYDGISDFLEVADIKVINQETILGGNERGFSGYPYFNSPTQVGDALAEVGFNVVLHASNHAADQGGDGLLSCVDFWKQYPDILMAGIDDDETIENEIPILEIGDITFAILNYTYGPNMETIPSNILGHLNILCEYNESNQLNFTKLNDAVLEDISKANEMADVVMVFPHWGTEYTTKPSSYQVEFAKQMVEAGADLIIGTHPHVVEPVEWITSENGNEALCYYSLGNYVSTQKECICMLEALAWVVFDVTKEGVYINREQTGVVPLVCQYKAEPVRIDDVYLLEDYTEEMADNHGIRIYGGKILNFEDLNKWSDEILGDFVITKDKAIGEQ